MQSLVPFYCSENWVVESCLIKMLKKSDNKTNIANDLKIAAFFSCSSILKKNYNYSRMDIRYSYEVKELFRDLIVSFSLTPDFF